MCTGKWNAINEISIFPWFFSMLEKIEGYMILMFKIHLKEWFSICLLPISCYCQIFYQIYHSYIKKWKFYLLFLTHVTWKNFHLSYFLHISRHKLQNLTLNYDIITHFSCFYCYFVKLNDFLLKFYPKIKFKRRIFIARENFYIFSQVSFFYTFHYTSYS